MKNAIKLFGAIMLVTAIAFTMTACGDGGGGTIAVDKTKGKLTISNLGSYDNKHAIVMGVSFDGDALLAAKSISPLKG
jgi:hypothetical protein